MKAFLNKLKKFVFFPVIKSDQWLIKIFLQMQQFKY